MNFNEPGGIAFERLQYTLGLIPMQTIRNFEYGDIQEDPFRHRVAPGKGFEQVRSGVLPNAILSVSVESQNGAFKEKVLQAMENTGVYLRRDETLEISLKTNRQIAVRGLGEERSAKLEDELNKTAGRNHLKTFYLNTEYARAANDFQEASRRANLIKVKDTAVETIRQQTGVIVCLDNLHRDEKGMITGYPQELAWVFERGYDPESATAEDLAKYSAASTARHYIELLVDEGMDKIPDVKDLDVVFRYTNGDFVKIDVKR